MYEDEEYLYEEPGVPIEPIEDSPPRLRSRLVEKAIICVLAALLGLAAARCQWPVMQKARHYLMVAVGTDFTERTALYGRSLTGKVRLPDLRGMVSRLNRMDKNDLYGLVWPAEGALTGEYGWRNENGQTFFSGGIDLSVEPESPVRAVLSGRITRIDPVSGGRYAIRIDHGGDRQSSCSFSGTVVVEAGDSVERGQLLGFISRTTGGLLHLELRVRGSYVDPLTYLPARM